MFYWTLFFAFKKKEKSCYHCQHNSLLNPVYTFNINAGTVGLCSQMNLYWTHYTPLISMLGLSVFVLRWIFIVLPLLLHRLHHLKMKKNT